MNSAMFSFAETSHLRDLAQLLLFFLPPCSMMAPSPDVVSLTTCSTGSVIPWRFLPKPWPADPRVVSALKLKEGLLIRVVQLFSNVEYSDKMVTD